MSFKSDYLQMIFHFLTQYQQLKLQTCCTDIAQKIVKVSGKDMIVKADRTFFCKLIVLAKAQDLDLYDVYFL